MNLFGVGVKSTPLVVFLIAVAIVALGWYSGLFESLFLDRAEEVQIAVDGEFQLFNPSTMYFEDSTQLPYWFPPELVLDDDVTSFLVARFPQRSEEDAYREIVKYESSSSMAALAA